MDQFQLYNKIVTNLNESVCISCFVNTNILPFIEKKKSTISLSSVILLYVDSCFFSIIIAIKIHITLPICFNFRTGDMKNIAQLDNNFSLLLSHCWITSTVPIT